jgi:integrase
MVLYWCGLRIGEACGLTFEDVNLAKGTLTINKTYNFQFHEAHSPKTRNSYRTVEMPLAVCDELNRLLKFYQSNYEHDQSSYLFPMTSFTKMRRKLNEWISLSKSKSFTHHDFRHSCVSLLANAGFNDFQAAKRMGHDVKMFNETYGHLFESKQKEMTKAMNKMAKN